MRNVIVSWLVGSDSSGVSTLQYRQLRACFLELNNLRSEQGNYSYYQYDTLYYGPPKLT